MIHRTFFACLYLIKVYATSDINPRFAYIHPYTNNNLTILPTEQNAIIGRFTDDQKLIKIDKISTDKYVFSFDNRELCSKKDKLIFCDKLKKIGKKNIFYLQVVTNPPYARSPDTRRDLREIFVKIFRWSKGKGLKRLKKPTKKCMGIKNNEVYFSACDKDSPDKIFSIEESPMDNKNGSGPSNQQEMSMESSSSSTAEQNMNNMPFNNSLQTNNCANYCNALKGSNMNNMSQGSPMGCAQVTDPNMGMGFNTQLNQMGAAQQFNMYNQPTMGMGLTNNNSCNTMCGMSL